MPIEGDFSVSSAGAARQPERLQAIDLPAPRTANTIEDYQSMIAESASQRASSGKGGIGGEGALILLGLTLAAISLFGVGVKEAHVGKIIGGTVWTLAMVGITIGVAASSGSSKSAAQEKLNALSRKVAENPDYAEASAKLSAKREELAGVSKDLATLRTRDPTIRALLVEQKKSLETEVRQLEGQILDHYAQFALDEFRALKDVLSKTK